jgi:hypothetical protein
MKSHHESMKVMKARNYKRFYPKTGAWEGAEPLLPHLDAQALVINNFLVHPVLFIEQTPNPLYLENVSSSIKYKVQSHCSIESIATLPSFGPIEGHKLFFQISSQWESQKNRFAFISFGKIQFLPSSPQSRCSCSYYMAKLAAAATAKDSTYGLW